MQPSPPPPAALPLPLDVVGAARLRELTDRGFVVLSDALTPKEVASFNAAVVADQAARPWPQRVAGTVQSTQVLAALEGHTTSVNISIRVLLVAVVTFQCSVGFAACLLLLLSPFDSLITHPATLPLLRTAYGDDLV